MKRLNAILVLVLAFSSVGFGASLMHISMKNVLVDASHIAKTEPSCAGFEKYYEGYSLKEAAKRIYELAYKKSFNSYDRQTANQAALCSAKLSYGTRSWPIDAGIVISWIKSK